jgi:hypothetical protein
VVGIGVGSIPSSSGLSDETEAAGAAAHAFHVLAPMHLCQERCDRIASAHLVPGMVFRQQDLPVTLSP